MERDQTFDIPYGLTELMVRDVMDAITSQLQNQSDDDDRFEADFTTRCDHFVTVTGDLDYQALAHAATKAVYVKLGQIIGGIEPKWPDYNT